MKTITKLALAALAVSSIVPVSVLADDVRTVVRYDGHGSSTIVYQSGDSSPTVAVYAHGQGAGYSAAPDSSSSPRLTFRDNGHGGSRLLYCAQ
jgi:hypothetical protein